MYYMSGEDAITTKYARIYAWLRLELDSDRIRVGERLPSENELCERFAASRPAARQALARLAHDGMIRTIRGSGSFRAEPPSTRSRDAALVLPALSTYIYPELVEAASAAFRERGFQTLIDCTDGNPATERRILESLRVRRPACVVVSPIKGLAEGEEGAASEPTCLDLLLDLKAAGTEVLLLDNELGAGRFSSIVIDDRQGGQRAVEFLWAKGHRAIAIAARRGHAPFGARRLGALAALAARGIEIGPLCELDAGGLGSDRPDSREAMRAALDRRISEGTVPTAVFCANDRLASVLAELLAERGLRVGAEISLVGFDDSPLALGPALDLTTFAYPSRWIGQRAAELLAEAVGDRGPRSLVRVSLEPELVERGSVRDLAQA
ncbi:MAG: substrate-binding domain-containing protein [Spirochaetaceae bacterium]|nr:substrate-binding domain-containing protein [Spirochaetaceae bacterium]